MMDLSPTTVAVVVVLSTIFYSIWRRLRHHLEHKKPFSNLPMPPGSHWLFGHLGMFGNDFRRVHQRMFYEHANGDGVCSFWVTGVRGVSVTDYRDARSILQSSVEHMAVPLLSLHLAKFVGPKNIGVLSGKEWKCHRAAILRVFHSAKTLENSCSSMVSVTETLVDSLTNQPQPLQLDVEPVMKMITVDVFGRTALNYDFECCKNLRPSQYALAFDFLGRELMRRLRNPLWPPSNTLYWMPTPQNKLQHEQSKLIRDFLLDLVEQRRQTSLQEQSPDLLTSLLRAHEELNEKKDAQVSDETLVDILMSLLFAGYDTTSITLTYCLYVLATNPKVEAACLQEIQRVHDEDGSMEDPSRLPYCQAVITETLRMYPPGFVVNRKTTKDLQLQGGFVIPQNTLVLMPIYMIQHDAKHFERPDEFLPERWVQKQGNAWVERETQEDTNGDTSIIPAGNRNALFAFSAGARSCAAQNFALQEAVLVMATLIRKLKFQVKPGYIPNVQRHGIVQRPQGGMPMKVCVRENDD